ncbi:uncharacterized protein CXQ87_002333 [Candidozyma duobushaemuli]|uniref:PXA domain-containing protein n=2 Tax=Candidozyma TaxID=3303203 RepID=A0ABX8I3M4_9ASCO|nr:uncharacterized protein CXQ87_002333 [[Candida] duobushaemulonis]PVH14206.1 hypothetical protein CXQ87_002333 [[Candida] duobushaemulonis]QWU87607.1 hypothetical protein CA3LBN_001872 [[Candida] haemuloni]
MVKVERGRVRKQIRDSKRFKGNQVKIGGSGIAKNEVELECSQMTLLSKLYSPGKSLSRLNEASKRQIMEHLPRLVEFPELNFEIHLFLATIATNYICSWYSKLGTDNNDFIAEVYCHMCTIVEDVVSRLTRAVEGDRFLFLVDDFARILKDHVEATEVVDGQFAFLREQKNLRLNRVRKEASDEELVDAYLASQHAIFDPQTTIEASQEPRNLYLRVLTHKLLEAVFYGRKDNPLESGIVDTFVVGLVGDFILDKAFEKLSSPSFIIGTVLAKIAEISTVEPKPQAKESFVTRAKNMYSSLTILASVASAKKQEVLQTKESSEWSVFGSAIFGFLNSISSFQRRIPIGLYGIGIAQAILSSLTSVSAKINAYCSSKLLKLVSSSPILEDQSMAENLKNLRMMLFEDQKESSVPPQTKEVAEKLLSNVQTIFANSGIPISLFRYDGETDKDIQACFVNALARFESQKICNDLPDSSKLNQLLIIQILDLIVARLYPELVDSGT